MLKTIRAVSVAIIAAVVAALLTAYFTYQQWNMDQNLSREKQDYDVINSTSLEIGGALSTVMTLQTNLYFTAADAATANSKKPPNVGAVAGYQTNSQQIYGDYIKAWNPLKEQISILIWKTQLNVDRIGNASNNLTQHNDLLDQLFGSKFNCETTLPDNSTTGQPTNIADRNGKKFPIYWNRASDNVATFYFCLLKVHQGMESVRD
jgi:hypothetical protein